MNTFINKLTITFSAAKNSTIAQQQSNYMRNLFPFLGIKKPHRVALEKTVISEYPLKKTQELHEILLALWQLPEREFQYTALVIARKYHKLWAQNTFDIFDYMICTKSWWDSVDDSAANLMGKLVQKYPHLVTHMDNWITDTNMWRRRTALIFQLRYKKDTDLQRLFDYILCCAHEKEFFIRKAIGWALREYSKHNPEAVRTFLKEYGHKLSSLSLKEAKKYL